MAPVEDPSEIISGKWKHVETECSKAGKTQSMSSSQSVSSTLSKAKKKIKNIVKKVKVIASGHDKGKKAAQPSAILSVAPLEDPPHSPTPSIAPSGSLAMDVDLPLCEDPADSDSELDSGSTNGVNTLDKETDEAQLEQMMKKWSALAYAFFDSVPMIEYCNDHKCHVFSCASKGCKHTVAQYLDTMDKESMGNMYMADDGENLENARKIVKAYRSNGTITSMFKRQKGKSAVTYSHRAHMKTETKAEIIQWVAESLHPFKIVKDHGFNSLMKMGWPSYYLPHLTTVSQDVKTVFAKTQQRIASLLQEYEGELKFATDTWTSPNHQAFVAITVHFIHDGQPVHMLRDFIEVSKSHSSKNLVMAFEDVLVDFRITEKILSITCNNASNNNTMIEALGNPDSVPSFPGQTACTRCFAHIINLVTKSLLKQFEPLKHQSNSDDGPSNDAECTLHELAEGLELEEMEA